MTSADQLRARAAELDDHADRIRWTEPTESRHLARIARELRELAEFLPPNT